MGWFEVRIVYIVLSIARILGWFSLRDKLNGFFGEMWKLLEALWHDDSRDPNDVDQGQP